MKTRRLLLLGATAAAVIGLLFATDPGIALLTLPAGQATAALLLGLLVPLLLLVIVHIGRKLLHPYMDLAEAWRKALDSPTGAGLALVAAAIIISGMLGLVGKAHAAGIPPQAEQYLPLLQAEIRQQWPAHPVPGYFGGLIEHETGPCPGRQCWQPTARLKTAREEGAGLGQLTRAWSPDGRTRFDALAEMRSQHPALAELDWATIYQRPDLQLRALVLKSRDDWRWLGQPPIEFVDLAYNAGRGRVSQDRRACALTKGCDPKLWYGQVELTCTASRQPIYGTRSACDISRHHVADVMHRAQAYAGLL